MGTWGAGPFDNDGACFAAYARAQLPLVTSLQCDSVEGFALSSRRIGDSWVRDGSMRHLVPHDAQGGPTGIRSEGEMGRIVERTPQ